MTLILKSNQSMTSPLPGTPTLPDTETGLALDYSFDDLRSTIANGSSVASISSSGSEPLTLSAKIAAAAYPTLTHNGPGGHAALTFAGNHMIGAALGDVAPPVTFPQGTPSTFALVVKRNTDLESERILGVDYADGYRYIAPKSAGGFRAVSSDISSPITALDRPIASGKWAVVIAVFNGTNSRVQINGSAPVTGKLDMAQMRGLRLGHTGGGALAPASFFNGQIACIKGYKRALTQSDIDGLTNQLMADYGITA